MKFIDMIAFGDFLRDLRHSHGLTLEEVGENAFISPITVARIEKGEVIPKIETLELLSSVYKIDLNKLILNYRMESRLNDLMDDISKSVNNFEIGKLENHLINLRDVREEEILRQDILLNQSILFLEGFIAYSKRYTKKSLILYSKGINKSLEFKGPDSFENIKILNEIEITLFLNMALSYYRLGNINMYEKIIYEVYDIIVENTNLNEDVKVWPKILHNLSICNYRKEDFKESERFLDKQIEFSRENFLVESLYRSYYLKSLIFYQKGNSDWQTNLKKSIRLAESFKEDKFVLLAKEKYKHWEKI